MNYRLLWRDLHFPSTPICCIADGTAGGFTVSEKPLFLLYHKKGDVNLCLIQYLQCFKKRLFISFMVIHKEIIPD